MHPKHPGKRAANSSSTAPAASEESTQVSSESGHWQQASGCDTQSAKKTANGQSPSGVFSAESTAHELHLATVSCQEQEAVSGRGAVENDDSPTSSTVGFECYSPESVLPAYSGTSTPVLRLTAFSATSSHTGSSEEQELLDLLSKGASPFRSTPAGALLPGGLISAVRPLRKDTVRRLAEMFESRTTCSSVPPLPPQLSDRVAASAARWSKLDRGRFLCLGVSPPAGARGRGPAAAATEPGLAAMPPL